jgi:hypothetical protein
MDLTSARWRKSSRSTNNGGACVEVATVSRTRPSTTDGGYPVFPAVDRVMAVRDSKHPDGPSLAFTTAQWATFTAGVKSDLFNL